MKTAGSALFLATFLFHSFLLLGQQLPPSTTVWPTDENPATYDCWHFNIPWVSADPSGDGTLFAYVSGELLKSGDSGHSWQRIGRGLPRNALFRGAEGLFPPPLSFSPFQKGLIFLGTDRQSVSGAPFRSDDGGETWRPLSICPDGPGPANHNFKFPASSAGVFSRTDKKAVYFPVTSERACQPVFVSLDGGATIVPNPMCPFYNSRCKHFAREYCLDKSGCFNFGGNYWGGDMLLSVSPTKDELFEFDIHGSLGGDYIARHKVLDRSSGQLCTDSDVFIDLSTVPGSGTQFRGWFKSPVFFGDDGTLATVCDMVQTGILNGAPVYHRASGPFLAECRGGSESGFVFRFVSFLPHGFDSVSSSIVKMGGVWFMSVSDKDLRTSRFLAWSPSRGGKWITFGDEGALYFSVSPGGPGLFNVWYIASYKSALGIRRSELRVITLDTVSLTYKLEVRYDFTGLFTGLTGFHVKGNGKLDKFMGWDFRPFRGVEGADRYVLFRGAELDIGTDVEAMPWSGGAQNFAFFDEGFYSNNKMSLCTSNFTSIAAVELNNSDNSRELWAYLSSDAGIWRNRKFHKSYDPSYPLELLEGFELLSGGYHCGSDCPGQIPAAGFGNNCGKVVLRWENPLPGQTVLALYASCRSGLWRGLEKDGGSSFEWQKCYDPPFSDGPEAGVFDAIFNGSDIFIVTAEGVLRSGDGCDWTQVFRSSAPSYPVTGIGGFDSCPGKIVISLGSAIYGSGQGRILCSEDEGATWYPLAILDPARECPVRQIECVVEGGLDTVYYLTADGILKKVPAYRGEKMESLGFRVESSSPCRVALSWKGGLSADSYSILRSSDGRDYSPVAVIGDPTICRFVDFAAVGGRSYTYTLKSERQSCCSSLGSSSTVTVPSDIDLSIVRPDSGPRTGGTLVEISGTGLNSCCRVIFGKTVACEECPYDPLRGTVLACAPPVLEYDYPHYADITVADGCNETVLRKAFRYELLMKMEPLSLPDATVGVPFPRQAISTEGGVPPYQYMAIGKLPPGLSISSSGIISGTPATEGVYDFVIRAADDCGFEITEKFSIRVSQPNGIDKIKTTPEAVK